MLDDHSQLAAMNTINLSEVVTSGALPALALSATAGDFGLCDFNKIPFKFIFIKLACYSTERGWSYIGPVS